MLPRRLLFALALCAMLCLTIHTVAEDVKPDASTPKGAAKAFFKAMETGDAQAARSLASGSEKQLAMLDLLVPVVSSFKQLENAAVKKWGEEGRKQLAQGPGAGGFDFEKELQAAKEDVSGDTATITSANTAQQKEPMKLKKIDGKWKIDMSTLPSEGLDNPQAGKMLKAMSDAARSTATEIDQGKYESAAKAKEAMGQKILPVLLQGLNQPGQGAPGAQPGQPGQPAQEQPKDDKK
ncbi:MAG TPA: hypothetical protein VH475_25625 [Tepidisphaeraceae bacterium]|jgi:hypothetical protein